MNEHSKGPENAVAFVANDEAIRLAREAAVEHVRSMGLPTRVELPAQLACFGEVMQREYDKRRSSMETLYGEEFSGVVALAVATSWYAIHDGALWFKFAIERGVVADNDYCRQYADPMTYARREGWAWAIYNKLSELEIEPFIRRLGIETAAVFDIESLLECIGLHWLAQASQRPVTEAFNLIAEAHLAFEYANGSHMWDAGMEAGREDSIAKADAIARKKLAQAGAEGKKRSDPKAAAKEQVRGRWLHWRAQGPATWSQAEFARQMLKDFPVLESQQTIERWCRDWSKDLSDTSSQH